MYTFLIDNRALSVVVAGLVLACMALFAIGVVVGLEITLQSSATEVAGFDSGAQPLDRESNSDRDRSKPQPDARVPGDGERPVNAAPERVASSPAMGRDENTRVESRPAAHAVITTAASRRLFGLRFADHLGGMAPAREQHPAPGIAAGSIVAGGVDDPLSSAVINPGADEVAPGSPSTEPATPIGREVVAGVAKPPDPARFSVQVGAFKRAKFAHNMQERLRAKGYDPYLFPIPRRDGKLLAVRFGRYQNRIVARAAATEIQRAEGIYAVLRPFELLP